MQLLLESVQVLPMASPKMTGSAGSSCRCTVEPYAVAGIRLPRKRFAGSAQPVAGLTAVRAGHIPGCAEVRRARHMVHQSADALAA